MTKFAKGLIMFVLMIGSVSYVGAGLIFGFDNVHSFIGFRTDEVRENTFVKLTPKEMAHLIETNLSAAKQGADATIENVLLKEEELAKQKAQRDSLAKELAQLKEILQRAVAWSTANPGGIYTSPNGKKYSFGQVELDLTLKNQRFKTLNESVTKLDNQIAQYEKFILNAKKQVDGYLSQVAKLKSKSDMAIADLTLRESLAKNYSNLGDGKSIEAGNFKNVEQMLGFVQNKLRSYDAIQYRQEHMSQQEVSDIDFGVKKEDFGNSFDEATKLLSGKTSSQNNGIDFSKSTN